MPASSVPYLIPFFLSALLSVGLGFYTINFLRVRGALAFMLMTFTQSAWTTSMIFEIISPTIEGKQFYDSVQWVLIFACVLLAYAFTQAVLPSRRRLKIPRWLLLVFPVIFVILMITNPALIYPNEHIVKGFPFDSHEFNFSWLDWIGFVYFYALLIFSIVTTFIEWRRTTGNLRHQLAWLLAGITVQGGLYFFLFVTGVSILGQRDTAPFTFLVGNLILAWGLFRYGFFELGSMARSQIIENMDDAFIVTDAQGKIVDMNRLAQEHALTRTKNVYISDAFKGWADDIKIEQHDKPFTHDFIHRVGDNLLSLEIRVAPLTNWHQDIIGYFIVVRDMTSRKMLENALAASEARYRSIIESMAEGVILYDHLGAILMCNQAAEAILGTTFEQIEGHNIREMQPYAIHEDGSPFTDDNFPISMTLRTGQPLRDAVMGVKLPDGTVKWMLMNSQPFAFNEQDNTETSEVIISFRDVTEMRRMQAEATRAEIAQDRARLLAQFVQSASHEFRTPLAIIGTSLYLVNRQTDPYKRQHHIETAEQEIQRIERLLETLVDMVQLDSGSAFNCAPTFLPPLVNSIVLQFEKAAKSQHIALHFSALNPSLTACVDPDYLTMGVKQILDNAIRFTPASGSVNVDITSIEKQVMITIRDTGVGIADDELAHIFDRFWRHDSAHSTPGFGLGLSIARKVVDLHNGVIKIDSKMGSGTTVQVCLPLSADQPSIVGTKSASPA